MIKYDPKRNALISTSVEDFDMYALNGYFVGRYINRDVLGRPIKLLPEIDRAYFNAPYTIVIWADGTKTVVKCSEEDIYHRHTGLAMCALKKLLGDEDYSEWKRAVNLVFDPRRLEANKVGDIWNYTYRSDK